jgi:hypothetical protein
MGLTSNKDLLPLIKETMSDAIGTEELFMEALRDMVKDEIKRHVRAKLDENPALREELKEAIALLMEAKAKEVYATLKLAKASAKLGLTLVPEDLKRQMSKELEKELANLMEKGL